MADGGTLFLDEIGELRPHAPGQAAARAPGGEIRPVGSATRRPAVDVRIIAATNRRPGATRSSAGRFREDLYYRLNVIQLRAAAAARAPRGHPAAGPPLPREVRRELGKSLARGSHRRGHAALRKLRLPGQRARAGERDRAGGGALAQRVDRARGAAADVLRPAERATTPMPRDRWTSTTWSPSTSADCCWRPCTGPAA